MTVLRVIEVLLLLYPDSSFNLGAVQLSRCLHVKRDNQKPSRVDINP